LINESLYERVQKNYAKVAYIQMDGSMDALYTTIGADIMNEAETSTFYQTVSVPL